MPFVPATYDTLFEKTIEDYDSKVLAPLEAQGKPLPNPREMSSMLLSMLATNIMGNNNGTKRELKWPVPKTLPNNMVAWCIVRLYKVKQILAIEDSIDSEYTLLGVYESDPSSYHWGTYNTDEQNIRNIARQFNWNLTNADMKEVISYIRDGAPIVHKSRDRDLIAMNNGEFNYETGELIPYDDPRFDPDERIYLSKSHVDFVEAQAFSITEPDGRRWTVDGWIDELFDDAELSELIWECFSAILRPNVNWDKSAWFYSTSGSNGKGTLCELMRNLCGRGTYAAIPIEAFSKDFMLEPLIHANAIIVDENSVGVFIDSAANLKAVITNDVITINRKYKMPIAYQFHGFMVQCLNEMPRIRDRSESFYRRQLFVPFEKTFTGQERRYIKYDYMRDKRVLEYVAYRALTWKKFYELSEPKASRLVLDEYKMYNDPLREFFTDVVCERTVWDLLPWQFVYDLYKGWLRSTNPVAKPLSYAKFREEMKPLVKASPQWTLPEYKVTRGTKMDASEPLIVEYDLPNWTSRTYTGRDIALRARPSNMATGYRGLVRTNYLPPADEEMDVIDLESDGD